MPPPGLCPSPQSLQCPNLPPHERAHHQVQFGGEICLACGRSLWMSPYHKQATSRQRWQVPTHYRAQAPPHLVPDHRVPDRLAYYETNQRRPVSVIRADQQVTGQQPAAGPAAATHGNGEVGPPPHPGFRRKHGRPPLLRSALTKGQTLTRARPFLRRAARIARPARVRIRNLNPCVLARRRLLGWNVRLLTGGSRYGVNTRSQPQGALERGKLPGKDCQGKLESVNGTCTSKHGQTSGAPAATCAAGIRAGVCLPYTRAGS